MASYGPPPGPPPAPRPPASPQQRATYLAYAGAACGLLGFIWGFLDWASASGVGGSGEAGFVSAGTGAIVAIIASGLVALAEVLEKKPVSLLPGALAVAGLLMAFGTMVTLPDGVDVSAGLILALITAIGQAAVLVFAWMIATGRSPAQRQPTQWQPGSPQYPPPYGGPQAGWGPPPQGQPGPPEGYGGSTQVYTGPPH